jgi:hypothetical protein
MLASNPLPCVRTAGSSYPTAARIRNDGMGSMMIGFGEATMKSGPAENARRGCGADGMCRCPRRCLQFCSRRHGVRVGPLSLKLLVGLPALGRS